MLSDIIRWIHYFVVLFLFFGFLLPPKYVWTYVLFVIILKIHWMKNNDKCILTELEHRLTGTNNNNNNNNTRYPFIGKMFSYVNISMTDEQYDYIFNVLIIILVFYSTCKYKSYLKKQNKIKYKLIK